MLFRPRLPNLLWSKTHKVPRPTMSKQHPVEFTPAVNLSSVQATVSLANELASLLFSGHKDLRKFVFMKLISQQVKSVGPIKLDIALLYSNKIPGERKMSATESAVCQKLQKIVNLSNGKDDYQRALSSIIERYRFLYKQSVYGSGVYQNVNIRINGALFEHAKRKEIDVAVDSLDSSKSRLELCECALTLATFDRWKVTQLEFYYRTMEEVRQVVGPGASLRLELVVGYRGSLKFRDRAKPDILAQNRIEFVGVMIGENREELIDWGGNDSDTFIGDDYSE
jgi:hypothetical protein